EGHTDNVGAPASNLTLSDARAAAVKATLVSDFGIDGGRITTKGLGDTKPAAPNTTALGRAQNRRVEIVKQKCAHSPPTRVAAARGVRATASRLAVLPDIANLHVSTQSRQPGNEMLYCLDFLFGRTLERA